MKSTAVAGQYSVVDTAPGFSLICSTGSIYNFQSFFYEILDEANGLVDLCKNCQFLVNLFQMFFFVLVLVDLMNKWI